MGLTCLKKLKTFCWLSAAVLLAACSSGSSGEGIPSFSPEPSPAPELGAFALQTPIDEAPEAPLEPILRWGESLGAQGYRVEVSVELSFSEPLWSLSNLPGTAQPMATIPAGTLTPGGLYYWRVVAFQGGVEMPAANGPLSFRTVENLTAPIALQWSYDDEKTADDPDYEETLANFFFPPGAGPAMYGYPQTNRPVVIVLRGGNANSLLPNNPEGSGSLVMFDINVLQRGWIGVEPNFSVIYDDQGEDFEIAANDIGLLIQYLRANAESFGLDPARIACLGRSGGAVQTYAVGLRGDLQDASSPNPVKHLSSRPDFCVALAGPTHLPCFSPAAEGMVNDLFFGAESLAGASEEMKLQSSPGWWLQNPAPFGRSYTPPFCFVYDFNSPDICGEIFDPHSGFFGDWMKQAMDDFVMTTGDFELGAQSHWIDSTNLGAIETLALCALWLEEKFDPHVAPKTAQSSRTDVGADRIHISAALRDGGMGAEPPPSAGVHPLETPIPTRRDGIDTLTLSQAGLAFAALAPLAAAQSGAVYPVGCPVPFVLANDTDGDLWYTPCPPYVIDANGNEVFTPFCLQIAKLLPPGEVYVSYWNQQDNNGQQVAPGNYIVGGRKVEVSASAETALTAHGSPRIGLSRAIELCSPQDPLAFYALAASGSSAVGIPLSCGLTFPLDFDALLLESISNPNVFPSFIGVLDQDGRTTDPRIAVPFQPSLVGIQFEVAFAVFDPNAACGVAHVSGTLPLAIQS
jgi:hypothetical protein